jgi:hypothetical protein
MNPLKIIRFRFLTYNGEMKLEFSPLVITKCKEMAET